MDCAVCGASLANIGPHKKCFDRPGDYYRCFRCASLVLAPLPADEEVNASFCEDDHVRSLVDAGLERAAYFRKRLDLLEPARQRSKEPRLLEVGCGCGTFLALAAERGWTVEAYELSPKLARSARNRASGAVIHETDFLADGPEEAGIFDAVVAIDVLEHVLSPRLFLQKCRRLQAPQGLLLLQTPNALSLRARLQRGRWEMLAADYHFHLFSRKGLIGLVREAGWEPIRVGTVSGSGREKGFARPLSAMRQGMLSAFCLGNALLMLAGTGPTEVR